MPVCPDGDRGGAGERGGVEIGCVERPWTTTSQPQVGEMAEALPELGRALLAAEYADTHGTALLRVNHGSYGAPPATVRAAQAAFAMEQLQSPGWFCGGFLLLCAVLCAPMRSQYVGWGV